MKIKSIELKKFKRFTHLIVEDIPDTVKLVVLVGLNGSGKTSFLESFNHYYKYSGYRNVGDYRYICILITWQISLMTEQNQEVKRAQNIL